MFGDLNEELRAEINVSSGGDTTVIAGQANQRTRIWQLVLWPTAAVTVIYKDGTTSINGAGFNFAGAGQGAHCLEGISRPLIKLGAGNDFVINLSAGVAVTGWVTYTRIPG
jgi:hypothetical protein